MWNNKLLVEMVTWDDAQRPARRGVAVGRGELERAARGGMMACHSEMIRDWAHSRTVEWLS